MDNSLISLAPMGFDTAPIDLIPIIDAQGRTRGGNLDPNWRAVSNFVLSDFLHVYSKYTSYFYTLIELGLLKKGTTFLAYNHSVTVEDSSVLLKGPFTIFHENGHSTSIKIHREDFFVAFNPQREFTLDSLTERLSYSPAITGSPSQELCEMFNLLRCELSDTEIRSYSPFDDYEVYELANMAVEKGVPATKIISLSGRGVQMKDMALFAPFPDNWLDKALGTPLF